jgi:hypothetical protein
MWTASVDVSDDVQFKVRCRVKFTENPLTSSISSFGIPHWFVFTKEDGIGVIC